MKRNEPLKILVGVIFAILFVQVIVAYADDYPLSWKYVTLNVNPNSYKDTVRSRSVAIWCQIKFIRARAQYTKMVDRGR